MEYKEKFQQIKAAINRKITTPSELAEDCRELLQQFLLLSAKDRFHAVTAQNGAGSHWDKQSIAVLAWAAAHSMVGTQLDITEVGDNPILFAGSKGGVAKLLVNGAEARLNLATPSISFPGYPDFGVMTGIPGWSFASVAIVALQRIAAMTRGLGRLGE